MNAYKLSLAALVLVALLGTPAIADTISSNSTNRVIHKDVDEGSGDMTSSSTEVQHLKMDSAQPVAPATTTTTTSSTSNGIGATTTVQQAGQTVVPAEPPHDSYEQTVITEQHRSEGGLRNEAVGINPQFGILAFTDANGITDSRGIAGLTVDVNGLRRVKTEGGRPFLGPSLGILYSHLGTQSSDFFGMNGPDGNDAGTHLLLIPFDIKAGYTFSDIFRPSIHIGATLVYNNIQQQVAATGAEVSGNSTSVHPNIGFDFEFGIGKSAAILIRPDWVFSTNTTIFSGTFGLVFPIS